ncbi:MAG: hypothetical protein Q9162_005571 [Coniocarpon cinnabarinum]
MPLRRLLVVCVSFFLACVIINFSFTHISDFSTALYWSDSAPFFSILPVGREQHVTDDELRPRYAFATFLTGPTPIEEAYVSSLLEVPNDFELAAQAAAVVAENLTLGRPASAFTSDLDGAILDPFDLDNDLDDDEPEGTSYYLSTRVLLYSLLHSPRSASHRNHTIPVLVLHTPNVPRWQLARLEKDGAVLVPVAPIAHKWIMKGLGSPRWAAVLAKLRLWELEEFDKVCFIDADTLVWKTLDMVFEDEATAVRRTERKEGGIAGFKVIVNDHGDSDADERNLEKREDDQNDESVDADNDIAMNDGLDEEDDAQDEPGYEEDAEVDKDTFTLPATYIFAGKGDTWGRDHDIPPTLHLASTPLSSDDSDNKSGNKPKTHIKSPHSSYLNAGFFVLGPDRAMFEYFMQLLSHHELELFPSTFPEQDLLNFVFRPQGQMPWNLLNWHWNTNWPSHRDLEAGVRSFHEKLWVGADDDGAMGGDETLSKLWEGLRSEMVGYWRGREECARLEKGER